MNDIGYFDFGNPRRQLLAEDHEATLPQSQRSKSSYEWLCAKKIQFSAVLVYCGVASTMAYNLMERNGQRTTSRLASTIQNVHGVLPGSTEVGITGWNCDVPGLLRLAAWYERIGPIITL